MVSQGGSHALGGGGAEGQLAESGGGALAADSGDICASCCSATLETVKVNYSINGGALQAVAAYYTSIIPHAATRGATAAAAAAAVKTRRWFNNLRRCSTRLRLADD